METAIGSVKYFIPQRSARLFVLPVIAELEKLSIFIPKCAALARGINNLRITRP